jgi:Cu(I)/Ag(I) efflux system protein CusF
MKTRIVAAFAGCLVVQACNQPAQEQASVEAQNPAATPAQEQALQPAHQEDVAYVEGVFAASHDATGRVTVINDDTVMINQEPVAALDWPAMTMTYEVRDPTLIAGLQLGEQISFSFRREGFSYVLTSVSTSN